VRDLSNAVGGIFGVLDHRSGHLLRTRFIAVFLLAPFSQIVLPILYVMALILGN